MTKAMNVVVGRLYEAEGGHKEAERASDEEYAAYEAAQIASETQVMGLKAGKVTELPVTQAKAKSKRTGTAFLTVGQLLLANKAGMSAKDILKMLA